MDVFKWGVFGFWVFVVDKKIYFIFFWVLRVIEFCIDFGVLVLSKVGFEYNDFMYLDKL